MLLSCNLEADRRNSPHRSGIKSNSALLPGGCFVARFLSDLQSTPQVKILAERRAAVRRPSATLGNLHSPRGHDHARNICAPRLRGPTMEPRRWPNLLRPLLPSCSRLPKLRSKRPPRSRSRLLPILKHHPRFPVIPFSTDRPKRLCARLMDPDGPLMRSAGGFVSILSQRLPEPTLLLGQEHYCSGVSGVPGRDVQRAD